MTLIKASRPGSMIIKFDPTKTKTKTTITITKTKTNTLINYQIIKFDPEYPYKTH